MLEPFTRSTLKRAFCALLEQPQIADQLSWWLLHGASIERWVQFELGFELSKLLTASHVVGCEQMWSDFVFHKKPIQDPPCWMHSPIAVAELKVRGNWHSSEGYAFDGIKQDIDKVRECKVPAAVLAIWFFARASHDNKCAHWVNNQQDREAKRQKGVANSEELNIRFRKYGIEMESICEKQLQVPGFDVFTAALFMHQNARARIACD